jgi:hypothetical protein
VADAAAQTAKGVSRHLTSLGGLRGRMIAVGCERCDRPAAALLHHLIMQLDVKATSLLASTAIDPINFAISSAMQT